MENVNNHQNKENLMVYNADCRNNYSDNKIEGYTGNVIHGDCGQVLQGIPEASIDLVVTSPPYADQRCYGSQVRKIKPDDYIEWFIPIANEIKRVIKDTGSFILNINDKVVTGKQHTYAFEVVIELTKTVGFNFVRDYIWYNPATPPNIFSRGNHGRTKKSHEYLFWFSKSDKW